jgi:hypothetical protein
LITCSHAEFDEVLGRSIRIYQAHAPTLLAIAAIAVPASFTGLAGSGFAVFILNIVGLVLTLVVLAALIRATAVAADGGRPSFSDSYGIVMEKFSTLLSVYLRTFGAAVGLALTIVGIPFAVRLLVRWYFAPQSAMLTQASAKDAISHSCTLVAGRWWQTAGFVLVTLLPGLLFSIALAAWAPGELASVVTRSGFSALVLPLIAAFWTLLFIDLVDRVGAGTAPEASATA